MEQKSILNILLGFVWCVGLSSYVCGDHMSMFWCLGAKFICLGYLAQFFFFNINNLFL